MNLFRLSKRIKNGFTILETAIAVPAFSMIFGLMVFIHSRSTDFWNEFELTTSFNEKMSHATARMASDLAETRGALVETVQFSDPLFESSQLASMNPTGRDSAGNFHVDAQNFTTQWQGVIVYCPYKTAQGVVELRRYVAYPDPAVYNFPFKFAASNPVTADSITLKDKNQSSYVINRMTGNAGDPYPMRVVASQVRLVSFSMESANLVRFELAAVANLSRYPSMNLKKNQYVQTRN